MPAVNGYHGIKCSSPPTLAAIRDAMQLCEHGASNAVNDARFGRPGPVSHG